MKRNGDIDYADRTSVLAAPDILQLWREDTTINAKEFNKALAILNGAKKITRQ